MKNQKQELEKLKQLKKQSRDSLPPLKPTREIVPKNLKKEKHKKKTFRDYVEKLFLEAPLPDYIDKDTIESGTSFAKKTKEMGTKTIQRLTKISNKLYGKIGKEKSLNYIQTILNNLKTGGHSGKGSSRSVYLGKGNSVIKLAHNEKGLAQNQVETKILSEIQHKYLIKLSSYDQDSLYAVGKGKPIWIELKRAKEITDEEFHKYFGLTCGVAIYSLERVMYDNSNYSTEIKIENFVYSRERKEFEVYSEGGKNDEMFFKRLGELYELILKLKDKSVILNDLSSIHNWGFSGGVPVIIDVGLDENVWSKLYKR